MNIKEKSSDAGTPELNKKRNNSQNHFTNLRLLNQMTKDIFQHQPTQQKAIELVVSIAQNEDFENWDECLVSVCKCQEMLAKIKKGHFIFATMYRSDVKQGLNQLSEGERYKMESVENV